MDEELIRLVIIIGTLLCLAGGLIAFLTTYAGYTRGQNPDKRLAFRMALQISLVALAVFAVIVVAIGFTLARVVVV